MIGFIFIYWIWKAFSNLALSYGKNKWLYFLIGFGSYFAVIIISAFMLGIALAFISDFNGEEIDNYDMSGWNYVSILFGGFGCYGTYKLLEYRAKKEQDAEGKDEIENIGLVDEN